MISDITTESEFISDVLCVGGPIDGRILHNIDKNTRDYEVAIQRPPDLFLSPLLSTMAVKERMFTSYSLEIFQDYDEDVYLFVHESIDLGEVLLRLIEHYAPYSDQTT